MHRGYVKEWRKELESDVWLMPPIYHRVWSWLRKSVNHDMACIPSRKLYGIYILPGQKITSIQQVAEAVSWVDGNKKTTPHKQTIARVLEWLVFHRMITVTSDAYGTLICIENWDTYNGYEPSHVTLDVSPSVRPFTTNKNDKNDKKESKAFKRPSVSEVKDYMAEISYPGNADNFMNYYTSKGWLVGKTPMKDWKAAVRTWHEKYKKENPLLSQQEPLTD